MRGFESATPPIFFFFFLMLVCLMLVFAWASCLNMWKYHVLQPLIHSISQDRHWQSSIDMSGGLAYQYITCQSISLYSVFKHIYIYIYILYYIKLSSSIEIVTVFLVVQAAILSMHTGFNLFALKGNFMFTEWQSNHGYIHDFD